MIRSNFLFLLLIEQTAVRMPFYDTVPIAPPVAEHQQSVLLKDGVLYVYISTRKTFTAHILTSWWDHSPTKMKTNTS